MSTGPSPLRSWVGTDEVIADATAVIELEPDDIDTDTLAWGYVNRAAILAELGRVEEALADATAVIELEPSVEVLVEAHYFRAVDLDTLGRADEAVDDLRRVVELLPSSHPLRLDAEQLLRELGADE